MAVAPLQLSTLGVLVFIVYLATEGSAENHRNGSYEREMTYPKEELTELDILIKVSLRVC